MSLSMLAMQLGFPVHSKQGKDPSQWEYSCHDYLKKADCDAGMLKKGEKVQFGMHNLRHSLATYLIAVGRDVKTVQTILRHANPMTTLQFTPTQPGLLGRPALDADSVFCAA